THCSASASRNRISCRSSCAMPVRSRCGKARAPAGKRPGVSWVPVDAIEAMPLGACVPFVEPRQPLARFRVEPFARTPLGSCWDDISGEFELMSFAGKVWRLLVGIKDGMSLLFLLLFFMALYALLTARPSPAQVREGALLLELDGVVVEEKSEIDPFTVLL